MIGILLLLKTTVRCDIIWIFFCFSITGGVMNIAVIDDIPDEISAVKKLLKEYAALNRFEAEISEFSSAEAFL